ncbi:carbohydrate-binding protein [Paenibacillus sp. LHD-117]|uniref:carbohydrate-binding protein n=1 Tax=Paenibacillus sp. LHD-117 TaxID=3071412 RepID=UPI0027E0864E|nr:carbohydrate-binding protein [Paenibacillus sp. LHD-117]MDQ6423396.1 carbohydrate-binding protein [Paenibacillus sp. LHD-117]
MIRHRAKQKRGLAMILILALVLSIIGLVQQKENVASAATFTYEAELSGNTLGGSAAVATCAGCSGAQKVGNLGNSSGTLQFNAVNGGAGGSSTLTIYYTAGDSTRSATVNVNGTDVSTVNFASTGGWNTVGTYVMTINLNAGSSNTIKFYRNGSYAPDIDKISLGVSDTPTPTPTPPPSASLEAEASGNTLGGSAIVSACSTCSGTQKVGYLGNGSGTLRYNGIAGGAGGEATLTIYYLAGDATRSATISVNGTDVTTINFPSTGSWSTVGTYALTIPLNAGSANTILFYRNGAYAPDIDKIVLSAVAPTPTPTPTPPPGTDTTYTFNQTTIVDNNNTTTITNGAVQIVYSKLSGLFDYYANSVKVASNMYSEFKNGSTTYGTSSYTSHTFSPTDVTTVTNGFGSGTKIVFSNTQSGSPTLKQTFTVYDGKPYFFVDLNASSGSSMSSNYMAPIKSDTAATSINASTNKRALIVPFDNDTWVRYNAQTVNSTGTGYEVMAIYDNDSRNGLIFGSTAHDTWKTGITYTGTGNNVTQLKVFGGVANSNTRDIEAHGSISGTSLNAPQAFVGFYADWRDGMEDYGRANATISGTMSWSGGVPFGWNSWGAVQSGLSYTNAVAHSNWIKNNLQNNNFNNNNTVYINLDSYWDNMTDQQLTDFVNTVHANGQKAGIYWAPFVYWSSDTSRVVEGSSYTYGDIMLKKSDGTIWGNSLDGAYPVDPTHPGTKQRINYFIDKFKSKGFDYIKLDFVTHGALEGQHYDTNVKTGIQAYNQGMAYVRDRIGGTMFISLSIAPLFPSQYGHSRRISTDAFSSLGDSEYVLQSQTYGWWQNGTIYKFTDPDHMTLSNNLEEARTRVNSGVIGGTVFLNGNDLTNSSQQAMASALLTNNAVNSVARLGKAFRATEGNTGTSAADTFVLNNNGTYYLAVFNYSSSSSKSMTVNLSRAGLSGTATYTVTNLWDGTTSSATGNLSVTLAANQSKLFKLQ